MTEQLLLSLEAEQVTPAYSQIENPYTVYRTTARGRRFYFREVDGQINFYVAVSSIIRAMMPQPEFLIKWKAELGYEEAGEYTRQRALRGTLMHELFTEFQRTGSVNLDEIPKAVNAFCKKHDITFDTYDWPEFCQKALLSLSAWINEFNVVPIAVEMPLVSARGFAGCIDLVAQMDIPQRGKEPIRGTVIVDFKSGSIDSDEYAVQLHAYKLLWEENFPHFPIAKIFNWAPTDFKKDKFTYKDKEQSDSNWNLEDFVDFLRGYKRHYPVRPGDKRVFSGEINAGVLPTAAVQVVTAEQAAANRINTPQAIQDAPETQFEYVRSSDFERRVIGVVRNKILAGLQ